MATRYTDEFRRDAVRIAVTSGLTRPQVSSDLGVGLSTLNKWVQKHQHDDLMSGPHEDVEKENERLRKEVRLLQELGLKVGHRRIGRLMRENDIKIIRTQKYKATTDSDHTFNIAPNLLDQDFSADGPNQKWAGDISYIWTSEGWLYLAVNLDLYSRRVIALRDLHANPFRVTAGLSATG